MIIKMQIIAKKCIIVEMCFRIIIIIINYFLFYFIIIIIFRNLVSGGVRITDSGQQQWRKSRLLLPRLLLSLPLTPRSTLTCVTIL